MTKVSFNIEAYINREVEFNFRSRSYTFALSQGLFSSAGIDGGSRFLLKSFSSYLDSLIAGQISAGNNETVSNTSCLEETFSVLDAGCGTGVLGICAAGALEALGKARGEKTLKVRCQDRDELARQFTLYNARKNGIPDETLSTHTEALLSNCKSKGGGWDLILTNIPAKAGNPVLEDFIQRSVSLLKKNGRVFMVAVNPKADFFRRRLNACALIHSEEAGKEHTVFVYSRLQESTHGSSIYLDENFPWAYPFYIREQSEYSMEKISYKLDTVHGAADFDSPGGEVMAAAKLTVKIKLAEKLFHPVSLLNHDAGQGHFALWLALYLKERIMEKCSWLLSGRNILALTAAKNNLERCMPIEDARILPAVDLSGISHKEGFNLIAYFPDTVPGTKTEEAAWESLGRLAAPGCILIAGMSSFEAERFDRKKSSLWRRLGDIKRKGFRAMAYQLHAESQLSAALTP